MFEILLISLIASFAVVAILGHVMVAKAMLTPDRHA